MLGEGKSTTAIALAINFAQLGQQVLLIDADMRKASVHKALGLPNERGLSNLLTGDMGTESLILATRVPNLGVLTAGPTPPDPVELLMGPKLGMLLEKAQALGFSQVIIDGPPLLGIADAIVLGQPDPAHRVCGEGFGDQEKQHQRRPAPPAQRRPAAHGCGADARPHGTHQRLRLRSLLRLRRRRPGRLQPPRSRAQRPRSPACPAARRPPARSPACRPDGPLRR